MRNWSWTVKKKERSTRALSFCTSPCALTRNVEGWIPTAAACTGEDFREATKKEREFFFGLLSPILKYHMLKVPAVPRNSLILFRHYYLAKHHQATSVAECATGS
jgi:hypothetical protein